MELPTYTSIWRIEKRLYKLYDFRLPMPLPVGQIAVFTAVTVPYVVLLTLFGLPFNHNLFWLYVLPPGLLTWLATRPVLESKRLPELLISQVRYLGEPSTWCRMAPLAEKDQVVVVGRVWRRDSIAATAEAAQAEIASAEQDQAVGELPSAARRALPIATPVPRPVEAEAAADAVPAPRARGRQGRGRLVRQLQVPERMAPEGGPGGASQEGPGGAPQDERVRPAAGPRESRWARAAGTARRTPAPGWPGAADPVRSPDSARAPGQAQGTPVAGADWARDAAAGVWRDPGLAGPAGQGRHVAPAARHLPGQPPVPGRPPGPVGYAAVGYATGKGARRGFPGTNGPAANGPVAGGAVANGPVAGGAGQPPRDPGTGRDAGTGRGAGTGWPGIGYGTAASARPVDPVADARPGDPGVGARPDDLAKDSRLGPNYGPVQNAGQSVGEGTRMAAATGWPVGYPVGPSMPLGGPAAFVGPPPGSGVASDSDAARGPRRAGDTGPASEVDPAAGTTGGAGRRPGIERLPEAGPGAAETETPAPAAAGPEPSASVIPETPAAAGPGTPEAPAPEAPAPKAPAPEAPAPERSAQEPSAPEAPAAQPPAPPAAPRRPPPVAIVPAQRSLAGPPPATPARPKPAPVERALSGPGERRTAGWRSHVTVVPGGRGPGRPDHVKEARARAVLPLDRPRLVVVLGCTVGAGQTVTALMLADLLAGLRGEPVAALDLNPGPASLTELAPVPAITVSALLADKAPGAHAANAGHRSPAPARGARTKGRLDVICQDVSPDGGAPLPNLQHDRLISVLASRYQLTFADPGAPAVAKLLAEAGQLVLVAPASPDAAQAVSMTSEYLAGHGHSALARHSIAVLNGVSQRSVRHAEQAEQVLRGRCRAIVRVPWDDHLGEPEADRGIRDSPEGPEGPPRLARLRPAVLQAYTALAGVLVSSLTDDPVRRRAAR